MFFQIISSYYLLYAPLFVYQFKFVRMYVYLCAHEYKYIFVKQRISLVFDINHIFYMVIDHAKIICI